MRIPRRHLCIAILALTSQLASAQDRGTTQPATMPAVTERIDLELPDTNVRNYVDHLAQVTGGNFVLFNDEGVDPRKIAIPRMRLRQIAINDAVNLLQALPNAQVEVSQQDDQPVPTYLIRVHASGPVEGAFGKPPGAATPAMRIFPLEQMLFGADPRESVPDDADRAKRLAEKTPQAMELIEQALLLSAPDGQPPLMKLHEASHTLLVKGTPEQIATVEQAFRALAAPKRSDAARDYERQVEAMQAAFQNELRGVEARHNRETAELKASQESLVNGLTRAREERQNAVEEFRKLESSHRDATLRLSALEQRATHEKSANITTRPQP